MTTDPEVTPVAAAISVEEGVALGYAMVMRVADDCGVRALGIKGPVLALQGLREPKLSVDIDVLVDPRTMPLLQAGLERLGWYDGGSYDTPGIVPIHSVNHRHPLWPIEIDLHHWFPGFLADPGEVFDVLWERRDTVPIAHVDVPVTDVIGSAAVAALHYLRDAYKQEPLERLAARVDDRWTDEQRRALAGVAADTGAAETLRPFLDRIGAPVVAPTRATVVPLSDWEMRSQTATTEVLPWLVGLRREVWWRRPAFVVRALWLGEEHFTGWDPSIAGSKQALRRARWARVRRGWRALPRAWDEYRRLSGRSATGTARPPRRRTRDAVRRSARGARRSGRS